MVPLNILVRLSTFIGCLLLLCASKEQTAGKYPQYLPASLACHDCFSDMYPYYDEHKKVMVPNLFLAIHRPPLYVLILMSTAPH